MDVFGGFAVLLVLFVGKEGEALTWGNGATYRPSTMTASAGDLIIMDPEYTLPHDVVVSDISLYLTGHAATIRVVLLWNDLTDDFLVKTTSDDIEVSDSGATTYRISTPLNVYSYYSVGIYMVSGSTFPIAYSDNDYCNDSAPVRFANVNDPPIYDHQITMGYLDSQVCRTFSYEVSYVNDQCIRRPLAIGMSISMTSPLYYDYTDYSDSSDICWEVFADSDSKLSVTINDFDLEIDYDFLYLTSGDWEVTLTGEIEEETVYCPTDDGLVIRLTTDGSVAGKGFLITVSAGDDCADNLPLLSPGEIVACVVVPILVIGVILFCVWANGLIKCEKKGQVDPETESGIAATNGQAEDSGDTPNATPSNTSSRRPRNPPAHVRIASEEDDEVEDDDDDDETEDSDDTANAKPSYIRSHRPVNPTAPVTPTAPVDPYAPPPSYDEAMAAVPPAYSLHGHSAAASEMTPVASSSHHP